MAVAGNTWFEDMRKGLKESKKSNEEVIKGKRDERRWGHAVTQRDILLT